MLRSYWTPVVASRAHVFYPLMTQEALWTRIVLAFVWTTAYLCIPGQLSIADSMDTVKISKRFACANELSKWHFGKLEWGYGQRPTLYITVADLGEELGRPRPLSYFYTKLWPRPKGRKNFFGDRPPPAYFGVWITGCSPLIWRSGFANV